MHHHGGPTDEPPELRLPASWKAALAPALARGVAVGLTLAVTLLPLAIALELQQAGKKGGPPRFVAVGMCSLFALAIGVVGGGPAAAFEARARARGIAPLRAGAVSGALLALGALFVVFDLAYVGGVVYGGMDAGLDRMARTLGALAGKEAPMVIGLSSGALLALGLPLGNVVAERLRGSSVRRQLWTGVALSLVGSFALLMLMGCGAAAMGGKFDEIVARAPLRGTLFAGMVTAGFMLLLPGFPLALLLPPALLCADRLARRYEVAAEAPRAEDGGPAAPADAPTPAAT